MVRGRVLDPRHMEDGTEQKEPASNSTRLSLNSPAFRDGREKAIRVGNRSKTKTKNRGEQSRKRKQAPRGDFGAGHSVEEGL